MANPFDQFDGAPAVAANPFDQFDQKKSPAAQPDAAQSPWYERAYYESAAGGYGQAAGTTGSAITQGIRRALNLPLTKQLSGEDIKDAASGAMSDVFEPVPSAITIPEPTREQVESSLRVPGVADLTKVPYLTDIAQALSETPHDISAFMQSPGGAASPMIEALPSIYRRLIAAGFTTQQVDAAINAPDAESKIKNMLFAAFGASGMLGEKPSPQESGKPGVPSTLADTLAQNEPETAEVMAKPLETPAPMVQTTPQKTEPIGLVEAMAELKRRNIVTPGEVAVSGTESPPATEPEPQAEVQPVDVTPDTSERALKRYMRSTPSDGGFAEDPLVQFVNDDMGGILSKSAAKQKMGDNFDPAQYDDAPSFSDPRHNKIYDPKSGQAPDVVASAAADAGLLPEGADASTLFSALQQRSDSAVRQLQAERSQTQDIKDQTKQYRSFAAAIKKAEPGEAPINASDLQVGDKVTVKGEPFEVKDIDPETYAVTMQDGSKFGIQSIGDDQVIYGEHEPVEMIAAKAPEPAPKETVVEPLKLAPPESVEEQTVRLDQEATDKEKRQIEQEKRDRAQFGWQQKLSGDTGDLGQGDMLGNEDLFAQGIKLKLKSKDESGAMLNPGAPIAAGVKAALDTETAKDVGATTKSFLGKSKFTKFKEALNKWVGTSQKADLEARRIRDAVQRDVPSAAKDRAVSIFREAGGDTQTIQAWLKRAKTDWFKQAATDALKLSPKEIAAAGELDKWYARKLQRGLNEGLVTGSIPDYVNHVWKRPEQFQGRFSSGGGKLNPSFRPGQERVLPTLFDGDQLKMTPKTIRSSELAAIYANSLDRASGAREFIRSLTKTKAEDGRPLGIPMGAQRAVEEGGPKLVYPNAKGDFSDYVPINHWALKKWKWLGTDENGKNTLIEGNVAIHPDYARHLEAAIMPSTIDKPEMAATAGARLARRAFRGFSKVESFVKQNMLSIPAFHYVQEGTEAIGHRVNPLAIEKPDPNNPAHVDAMNHGLMVADTHGGDEQWIQGLTTDKALINKIPGIGPALRASSRYLFEEYIPSLKIKTYEAALNRNIDRFGKELKSGEMTLDDVKYHTAKQVNDAFGHLNYADLGRSENAQKLLRTFLLAPDFLEARGRQAAQGVAGLVPGSLWRTHAEQRMSFFTLAAGFYIAARALNYTLNGDPHMKLKDMFAVYYGGRRYTMRSVPEDVLRAITDTRKFITSRLAPLATRAVGEALTGKNYLGQKVDAKQILEDTLSQAIPLGLRNVAAKIPGLGAVGNEDIGAFENFRSSLGLQTQRASPIIDAHGIAHDWMASKGIPPDEGVYPRSKYARLRNALEDGDMQTAKAAYQELLKTEPRAKISQGFQRSMQTTFTKSQATDRQMLRELSGDDKATVQKAISERRRILSDFLRMPK